MIAILTSFLQILLIITAILIVLDNNKIKIIVFFSVFSLITASLYYFNSAADVALAEVAIGAAIMPLILTISISKQKEFIVINHIDDLFFKKDSSFKGEGYKLLEKFAQHYGLTLKIYLNNSSDIRGVFRKSNVDLVIKKSTDSDKYLLKGKKSSILMNKLSQMVKHNDNIELILIKEGETYD